MQPRCFCSRNMAVNSEYFCLYTIRCCLILVLLLDGQQTTAKDGFPKLSAIGPSVLLKIAK